MERWEYISFKQQREEGRRDDLLFLLINSIIIVNQSFGLLKIHGRAMFAAITRIPNVEHVIRLCTWLVVKEPREVRTAFWSFMILYSLACVRTTIGWLIGVRKIWLDHAITYGIKFKCVSYQSPTREHAQEAKWIKMIGRFSWCLQDILGNKMCRTLRA